MSSIDLFKAFYWNFSCVWNLINNNNYYYSNSDLFFAINSNINNLSVRAANVSVFLMEIDHELVN